MKNIPFEEYDDADDCEYEVEFEREEWPEDEDDCSNLEYFLIYIGLGITLLRLKEDKGVKKYLENIEKLVLYSGNEELYVFKGSSPDDVTKKRYWKS